MSNQKQYNIEVSQEIIDAAERDVVGRCMVAEAIKAAIPGASRVEVDMQTVRFTVDGERETYFTPWDVANSIVLFDGGDPIDPFSFRLVRRNRVIMQRQVIDEASKPVDAAAARARYAARRAAAVAADPDASRVKKAKAKAKAEERQAEYEQIKAERGPVRRRVSRPVQRVTTDTEIGVVKNGAIKRSAGNHRTMTRIYGARELRANQPDARARRGFAE